MGGKFWQIYFYTVWQIDDRRVICCDLPIYNFSSIKLSRCTVILLNVCETDKPCVP